MKIVLQQCSVPLKKVKYSVCIVLLMAGNLPILTYAQQGRQVSGRVVAAADTTALPGVTILIKGTTTGTTTGADGYYSLTVPQQATTLIFSSIGYATQEVAIGDRSVIDVRLQTDVKALSEVVVTALGIEREKKDLGYAVQEVQGEELTEARETNIINSLAGRVAGVQITNSASGIGGSARVTIRGESSLDINKNQPLFVVDGVPISNQVVGASGRVGSDSNLEVDYGNGAGEINPDDVASITVLKGPTAAALYGSRAANGAIIITTKTGKGAKGIGISVNSNATFEEPLVLPDWQDVYGQGNNGQFAFEDGAGGGVADGVDESWGPRMDAGLSLPQFDSPTSNGFRGGDINIANRGTIQPTPWVSRPGNIDEFFRTGTTFTNNVSITGSNDKGDFRLSLTNLTQKGYIPNTNLERTTIALNGGYNLSDKLTARASVNYIKSESDNRPSLSYGTESLMYLWIWYGRQINTLNLRNYWQPGLEGRQQFNYNYNYHDNPYFTVYENTNGQTKDRVLGNISLNYKFTDGLSLLVRTGTDFYNELRDRRRAFSTQRFPLGMYREDNIFFEERNSDFLLTYNKALGENFSITASAGGNQMRQTQRFLQVAAPQLLIPGIYNFSNSAVNLESTQIKLQKRINSLYGFAQVGFRNFLFLDLTARNDWSSTLPARNNSYFYPSATLSAVFSDMFQLPAFVSFAKLRMAVAQVGNDTDPYRLRNVFNSSTAWGNIQIKGESATIANAGLKPETVTTYEIGTDLQFFNDRLGIDFTYYDIRSRNQILPITIAPTSGYTTRIINAGEIKNQGIELMLTASPIQVNNGFKWDVSLNFTRNRSEVVELAEGIESYTLSERNGAYIQARVGQRMGAIYGQGLLRVTDPESPYFGQPVNSPTGVPLTGPDLFYQGNYNPDWMLGLQNTFSYKGLSLGFLFDVRYGGIVVSRTKTIGSTSGQLEETLLGRANGYDLAQEGNGIVAAGVKQVFDAEGNFTGYAPNDVEITSRNWHNRYYERSNVEVAKYDASYIKLREVKIGYSLPNSLFTRLPFKNVTFSVVGRNLLLWTENPHFDPETLSMAGGTLQPGIENMAYPSTRSMGFNLSFKL